MKAIACAETVSKSNSRRGHRVETYSYERQRHIDDELGKLLSLKVLGFGQ